MASTPKPTLTPIKATTPAPSTAKNKPAFSDTEDTVTFLVGPKSDQKKFFVDKSFACHYSPVLKAAFTGDFIEGQTQTYKLEDTTAGAFTFLVEWLYTQKVNDTNKFEVTQCSSLIYLWVLAEKLLIPRLQNQIIDAMEAIRASSKSVNITQLKYIYQNTAAESPLRRFFVNFCVWYLSAETYNDPKCKDFFPEPMLYDLCFHFRRNFVCSKAKRTDLTEFYVEESEKRS